jgi:uncharacterized RDD family membrane protein YckC
MDTILRVPSVTGIDLELRIAGPGARSYAFVIDWHIRVLAALGWLLAGALATGGAFGAPLEPSTGYTFGVIAPSATIYFLYHPVLEIVMRGRTPGKRIAGVRIVKRDGGAPGIGALLIRNAFRLVDSLPMFYLVGLGATIVTEQSVRIGDIAAGTLLVYDEARPDEALDGLPLEAVARLGLENAELVRDMLTRWNEIRPQAREDLARGLLGKLRIQEIDATDAGRRAQLEQLIGRTAGPAGRRPA